MAPRDGRWLSNRPRLSRTHPMTRSLVLVTLVLSLAGCTRFGTNPAGGPFARKPRTLPDPYSPVPPAPPTTNSPLALQAPGEVVQVGGVETPKEQVLPKRRIDPKTEPRPRPFAKD